MRANVVIKKKNKNFRIFFLIKKITVVRQKILLSLETHAGIEFYKDIRNDDIPWILETMPSPVFLKTDFMPLMLIRKEFY